MIMCIPPNWVPTLHQDVWFLFIHAFALIGLFGDFVGVGLITIGESDSVRNIVPFDIPKADTRRHLRTDLKQEVAGLERRPSDDNQVVRRTFRDDDDEDFELLHETVFPEVWEDKGIDEYALRARHVEEKDAIGEIVEEDNVKIVVEPRADGGVAPTIHLDIFDEKLRAATNRTYYYYGTFLILAGFALLFISQAIQFGLFIEPYIFCK